MDFLVMADPGVLPTDALTGLVYAIIKILAYSAIGVVFFGIIMTCLCDLFGCRKLRRCHGRSEVWQLIH
jgi:hypothetical protein